MDAINTFLVGILSGINTIVNNYGWSIVVFTILIKLVLFPLDLKSRKSMRRMSSLQPQIAKLQKKYANDKDKLNQKTAELYRKEHINPLSGCLPMLISLPVLFAMFAAMPLLAGVTILMSVKRKKWRVLLPVLLVMGGAALTGLIDQALYRANEPHWDAFRTYYQMRVQLLDYYNTDVMEKVATQTLGWPVDTVRLMRNWYMLDEHMQLEPLTELITAVKAAQPEPSIWDLAKSVASILRRYSMFSLNALGLGVAALWALIRFGKQRRWAEGLAVLGTITYMLVFIAYFYGILNRLPQRAAFSIACPTAVVLLLVSLPSLENNLKDASPRLRLRAIAKPAIWVMTLCLCMAMLTNAFWAKNRLPLRGEQNGQAVRAAISEHIRDYASARPESVFVTDVAQRYTPFTTEPFTAVNLLEWGHAMRGSDVLAKKYAANDLNGFTTDTLFDSRVRLILSDGNRALFVNYIQQRNASAHLVTVDYGDGFTVYQLKAGEQ